MSQDGEGVFSFSERERIACAKCLGLNPARILEVAGSSNGNGGTHYVIKVALDVHDVATFVDVWGPRENGARER